MYKDVWVWKVLIRFCEVGEVLVLSWEYFYVKFVDVGLVKFKLEML